MAETHTLFVGVHNFAILLEVSSEAYRSSLRHLLMVFTVPPSHDVESYHARTQQHTEWSLLAR
jgi:hypothetical protein